MNLLRIITVLVTSRTIGGTDKQSLQGMRWDGMGWDGMGLFPLPGLPLVCKLARMYIVKRG